MKKNLILCALLLSAGVITAQNINDGLRYSTDLTTGTARFGAMSGAFGALGGDLSAIAINPAGSAIFLDNSASFTGSLDAVDSSTRYFNGTGQNTETDVNINQAGGVFLFDLNPESKWKKISLGVNYNQTSNLDNEVFIQGNGNSSVANFFLEQAQGLSLDVLELQGQGISGRYAELGATRGTRAQNAFLGYQGFIFDPFTTDPGNTQYVSNVAGNRFDQDYVSLSRGFNGKFSFNLAAQYTDDFFFGINLNSHTIDYDEGTFMFERNSNQGSTVNRIEFENNLSVLGAGFSAQVGAIAKIGDQFRLGLTYDTPTWFVISEETSQYLETERTVDGQSIVEIVDPRIINVFADYNLRTPSRIAASGAYVFGQSGLISFDYSFKNYGNIEFTPAFNDGSFDALNATISDMLQGASTYRVGGEYRIGNWSLRGGFSYEESPYSNKDILGDRQGYSAGFGYNFGMYSFDFAYMRSEQDANRAIYNIGLTDTAAVETVFNNFLFTLGLQI
ncbi:MAG: outer membrane protein transport protein [Bacteroidota bacterium]